MRARPSRTMFFAAVVVGAACNQPEEVGSRSSSASGQFLSGSYGGRNYKLYVPTGYHGGQSSPLVLMLHGCTQDPSQFSTSTAMNNVAESATFLALYPEQSTSANSTRCWNWFRPGDQARGAGEPAFMAGLIGQIQGQYDVDGERVFVAGFSAGAGMAAILPAAYPDLFAASMVAAGLEYGAATTQSAALSAMQSGGPSPVQQGQAAYRAMGPRARAVPMLIFYGSSDTTVAPVNGQQVLSQWARTDDLADDGSANGSVSDTPSLTEKGQVPGGRSYTHTTYNDSSGRSLLERYVVDGMNHAWSGGQTGGYVDAKGPSATALTWAFFLGHPRSGAAAPDLGGGGPDLGGGVADLSAGPADLSAGARDLSTGTPDLAPPRDLSSPAPDLRGGGSQVVLTSIAAEDGYAGALLADGAGTTVRKAGDKGLFNGDSFRCVLSFDTSALPPGATGARLRVFRKALAGVVSSLTVDVKSGAFGASSAIEQADYGAPATQTGVAQAAPPAADQQAVEFDLQPALGSLNRGGRTQVRLRAVTPVDFKADGLEIYGGDGGALAPQLIVAY